MGQKLFKDEWYDNKACNNDFRVSFSDSGPQVYSSGRLIKFIVWEFNSEWRRLGWNRGNRSKWEG
jgi:hypothetical protein